VLNVIASAISAAGVVVGAINGRAETRTYAKPVLGGKGAQQLSPEEAQAVHTARTGTGLVLDGPAPAGRGNHGAKRAAATA